MTVPSSAPPLRLPRTECGQAPPKSQGCPSRAPAELCMGSVALGKLLAFSEAHPITQKMEIKGHLLHTFCED